MPTGDSEGRVVPSAVGTVFKRRKSTGGGGGGGWGGFRTAGGGPELQSTFSCIDIKEGYLRERKEGGGGNVSYLMFSKSNGELARREGIAKSGGKWEGLGKVK